MTGRYSRCRGLLPVAAFVLLTPPAAFSDVVLVSESSGKLLFIDTASPNPLDSVIAAVPLPRTAPQRVAASAAQGLAFVAHNRQGTPAHGYVSVVDIANVLNDTNAANDLVTTLLVPSTPSSGGQNVGDIVGLASSPDGTRLLVIAASLGATGGAPLNEGTAYLFDTDRSSAGFGNIVAFQRLLGHPVSGTFRPGAAGEVWTPNALGVGTANAEPGIHVRSAAALAPFAPSRNIANFGPSEAFAAPIMVRFDAAGAFALVPMSANGQAAAISGATRAVLASRLQFGVAGAGACASVGTSWPQTGAFSPAGNRAVVTLLGGRPFNFGCGPLASAVHGVGFADFNGTVFSNAGTLAVNTAVDGSVRSTEVLFDIDPDAAYVLTSRGVLTLNVPARTRASLLRLGFCAGEGTAHQASVSAPVGAPRRIADYRDTDANGLADQRCDATADTTPPAIQVTSPNGGETWTVGVPAAITWTASDAGGLGGFDVSFSADGGLSFAPIAECQSLPGTATSCSWLSPAPATTQALIRVTARDVFLNQADDASNAVFTIEIPPCPTITVTGPTSALVGAVYSAVITAAGSSDTPYEYAVAGELPAGLTLTTDVLSGTPTAVGSFRIQATDAGGCTGLSNLIVIGSPVAPGDIVISEFRTRGRFGPRDEYVELGNRLLSDVVVLDLGGSGGWSIATSGGNLATIPDGTLIPKGGHWLLAGEALSLSVSPDHVLDGADIPDDAGLALFSTASPAVYSGATRLDSVGTGLEGSPLFVEGTPLPEVVQTSAGTPLSPTHEVAWVRRLANSAILSDVGDNARDFVFVAADGGSSYGPAGDFQAVLGGPNPEGAQSSTDILNAEFPVSLADPARGENQQPNRVVVPHNRIDFRRAFTNSTGRTISGLGFKVINLSTLNSRHNLQIRADLRVADAPSLDIGSGIGWVERTELESPGMYPLAHPPTGSAVGGLNSRLIVPLSTLETVIPPGGSIGVNFRATIWTSGYYVFILVPQVAFENPAP